ncbi:MAG: queuine tRNA-ribosyltransferase family protein [Anaerolineae bacterium]|nr:queuine tRNA-ribosyltransferase family protein [Anaerolineae bacterium]
MPDRAAALELPHGRIELPAFLPDATMGVVRAVDSEDLERCGVQALVMNTFHLMQRPGTSTIQALGGIHAMSGWRRPIITDSGGFQAYSLIRQDPHNGRLDDRGITFRPEGARRRFRLTPEKSVQLQLRYGADIVICLDDCTHADAPLEEQREAVRRTVDWARRCKEEFQRGVERRGLEGARRPLLFAVVQGGRSRELRKQCAESLLEIGFDGFGYGGWPLDADGRLLADMLAYTRELIPDRFPMHALGVGHPPSVVECVKMGYDLFDSAMPTRDARHGRLYTFMTDPASGLVGDWFGYVYVGDDKHIKSDEPVSSFCDALCCTRYSLGYLHHLFKIKDSLYLRLATIHNVRFMMMLMGLLRRRWDDGAI